MEDANGLLRQVPRHDPDPHPSPIGQSPEANGLVIPQRVPLPTHQRDGGRVVGAPLQEPEKTIDPDPVRAGSVEENHTPILHRVLDVLDPLVGLIEAAMERRVDARHDEIDPL